MNPWPGDGGWGYGDGISSDYFFEIEVASDMDIRGFFNPLSAKARGVLYLQDSVGIEFVRRNINTG